MRSSTPAWTIPLTLALLGLVIVIGGLEAIPLGLSIVGTLIYAAYALFGGRWVEGDLRPPTNLMALLPGHLLLLLAISMLDAPDALASCWALLPTTTVAYDVIARQTTIPARRRVSILIGLYAILWIDVIVLLERTIALRRGFTQGVEILIAVAFGLAGSLFLGLGIYRHWLTVKE